MSHQHKVDELHFRRTILVTGCCAPLTTREKGAGIGALGLGAGAVIGDKLQGQEMKQEEQQKRNERNQAEIERQRRETEKLKSGLEY